MMVKFNFRNKFLSILAAMIILVGTLPVVAADVQGISITANSTNWDDGYRFTSSGTDMLVMQMFNDDFETETNPWISYSIYAEEEGTYKFEFKTSPLADGSYTSPATFSVNGEVVPATLKQSIDTNTKIYTVTTPLNAGENIIRFDITGRKPNAQADGTGEQGLFHIYYINCQEYTFAGTRFEGEGSKDASRDFTATFYDSSAGFKYSQTDAVADINAGNRWWKYSFTAPAGTYKFIWRSTDIEGTRYVSPVKLTVNGEEVHATTKQSDGDPWFIQSTVVDLVEGTNEVKFQITATKNFGAGTNALVYIDYIEFTDAGTGEKSSGLKFEGEDASGSVERITGANADGFSGNAWNRVRGTATTTFTSPADDFDLYITVGADIDAVQHENGKYLGTAAISIDGGEFIPLSGTNMTKIEGLTGSSGSCANTAKWQYKPGLTLTDGAHTFEIKYVAVGSNGNAGNTFIFFDCFELIPKNGVVGEAILKVPQNKVFAGTQMQANSNLYYTTGYIVESGKVSSTKYTSSNPLVASIESDGTITTINPGIAEITVTYNDTYTDSVELRVCDESGIIPVSSSYDEETGVATVKLTRIMNATGNATVIFGAYTEENGMATSFSDMQVATEVNPGMGRVKTVSNTVVGDNVFAFIWDSLDGLKPFADVIKLK